MKSNREITVQELADLSSRMVSRGNGNAIMRDEHLQQDCLACGRVIAMLIATGTIRDTITLRDSSSPPTAPN